jgi:glycosyltransferase involved in cell wall biosynthesis
VKASVPITNIHGERRRVLLASHHASRRGSAISLVELGIRLAEYGYEPVFVFSKHGTLVDDLIDRGYRVVQIKRAGLLRVATIREAFALIRELGISLVHVNSAVPFSKYIALAARLAGVPVVWHIREPVEDKRMTRQRRWIRWLANRIVVLTRQQASFFNAPDKTARVFNGVDLVCFRRQTERGEAKHTLGYTRDEFLFIQIGSIEHNKGQYRAVQALAQLLADLPHCRLLIVGAMIEPEELNAVEAFVATNPALKAAVRLYGETADVRPLIWAADCLLLPSLRESFPRTIMEAMAAGTPVIASAVGAVEDMVDNGVTGLLVPPDDVGALATAMRAMATTDLAGANSMATNCEKAAARSFSMEAHMAAVTSIYDNLLAPHLGK